MFPSSGKLPTLMIGNVYPLRQLQEKLIFSLAQKHLRWGLTGGGEQLQWGPALGVHGPASESQDRTASAGRSLVQELMRKDLGALHCGLWWEMLGCDLRVGTERVRAGLVRGWDCARLRNGPSPTIPTSLNCEIENEIETWESPENSFGNKCSCTLPVETLIHKISCEAWA